MPSLSPLACPSATRAVLAAHGLAAKKALGQNFLVNDAVLQKIVALAELAPNDVVLEVGPGIGTLTIALLKSVAFVVSVERDAELPAVLAETCAPWAHRLAIINKDALAVSEAEVEGALKGLVSGGATARRAFPNKFVANLPYAVAATLVLDCFERFPQLESATVMVQKEVADRMMAAPGTKDYGAFTVKLSLYAEPADRFPVAPASFFPPPHVMSAVLRLNRRELRDEKGALVPTAVKRAAATMADAAFANRRKTIANSCKAYFAGKGAAAEAATAATANHIASVLPRLFEQAGIDPRRRGETLSTQDFLHLGKAYLQEMAAFSETSLENGKTHIADSESGCPTSVLRRV